MEEAHLFCFFKVIDNFGQHLQPLPFNAQGLGIVFKQTSLMQGVYLEIIPWLEELRAQNVANSP